MTARFRYACFISYIHSEAELGRGFVMQFVDALQGELEQLVDLKQRPIYRDNLVRPGDDWQRSLSTALCQSVCMVLIYSPVYGRRPECLREFEAMMQIETERRALLAGQGAPAAPAQAGFIIPVVLRGFDRLPEQILRSRQAVDFSHFTLAEDPMQSNRLFVDQVRRIAERIQDHLDALEPLEGEACKGCQDFRLPDPAHVKPWAPAGAAGWRPAFPGR